MITIPPEPALVIIPTCNERANIGALVALIRSVLDCDILVVDGASDDGTPAFVRGLMRSDPRLHLVAQHLKSGIGTAYLEGFAWALERDYGLIFQMDADLSHDPAHLPAFIDAIEQGADLVIGSRNIEGGGTVGWSWFRRGLSRTANLYAQLGLGLPVHDLTGGFKCFRRRVLETIGLGTVESNGYTFQIELTWRALACGFKVAEVPIVFSERTNGDSKMPYSQTIRQTMWKVLKYRMAGFRPPLAPPASSKPRQG